jgi:hypothetical protein
MHRARLIRVVTRILTTPPRRMDFCEAIVPQPHSLRVNRTCGIRSIAVETTPGNKTTIFEAPEYGVAVWWELLRNMVPRQESGALQLRCRSPSSAFLRWLQKPSV